MKRRSFFQMAAMLVAACGLPDTTVAAAEQSTPPARLPRPLCLPKYGSRKAVIKVIGVGGCGGNAVDHMIGSGLRGIELICANTDAEALKRNLAAEQLLLGTTPTKGLGAGGDPHAGRDAALEEHDRIAKSIQGADMLFIVAGMGGGTGSGAAPVVAQVAQDMGVLTVALVTYPFLFERERLKVAQAGIDNLAKHADSMILVPNEKLIEILGNDVSFQDAFKFTNDLLLYTVADIANTINTVNSTHTMGVDFAEVKAVMLQEGRTAVGSATAAGVDRALFAAEQAVKSPLLGRADLARACGVLVNITASSSLTDHEFHQAAITVAGFTMLEKFSVIETTRDERMADKLRVTVIATGIGGVVNRYGIPDMWDMT